MILVDALLNLRPNAFWHLNGDQYEDLEWLDTNQEKPTKEELATEISRLKAQLKSTEYQRKREREYPPLTELADALYHQQNGDDTKMTAYLAKCEAVKQKYPKE